MEIGVSTASLFLREYNEDSLVTLNEIDARTCEIFLESFSEYTEEFGKLLLSRKGNLNVHSLHVITLNFETELFSANQRAFNDANYWFERVLSTGKLLGAHCYTMHGRARIKAGSDYDNYEKAGKRLAILCETAAKYGIKICLENVAWAFCSYPDFFRKVKQYAPDLMATLDIKQARRSGIDYREYIDAMGQNIKTVHISDVDENGKIKLPGEGTFDFEELFRRLKDVGFNGDALIEVYKDDYGDVTEIKRSLDKMREIAYKIF